MKLKLLASMAVALAFSVPAAAAVIDFTGGTITRLDSSTVVTSGSGNYDNVDYYEENGFRMDFIPNSGSAGFASNVGTYYGGSNDVIHVHWDSGNFGGVTEVLITKIGGGSFDLNYFILTSNTDRGGQPASGNEQTWIRANGGPNNGYQQMLPPENWGFPAQQIFLGSQFDAVTSVSFFTTNAVDCFGMDEFFIDEPPPPQQGVPEPWTLALFGLGLLGLVGTRKLTKK